MLWVLVVGYFDNHIRHDHDALEAAFAHQALDVLDGFLQKMLHLFFILPGKVVDDEIEKGMCCLGIQRLFRNRDGSFLSTDLAIPEQCPFCKRYITPSLEVTSRAVSDDGRTGPIIGYWSCNGCAQTFAVRYKTRGDMQDGIHRYYVGDMLPPMIRLTEVDEQIRRISPRFEELLHQAEFACDNDLVDLAGMGFRKALEFLVKDYLIYKAPEDEERIRNMELGNCIANRIDNQQLKTVASRATWLGNDFTHFTRRFDEYEVSDLKRFIEAVVYWILMELTTEEALSIDSRR